MINGITKVVKDGLFVLVIQLININCAEWTILVPVICSLRVCVRFFIGLKVRQILPHDINCVLWSDKNTIVTNGHFQGVDPIEWILTNNVTHDLLCLRLVHGEPRGATRSIRVELQPRRQVRSATKGWLLLRLIWSRWWLSHRILQICVLLKLPQFFYYFLGFWFIAYLIWHFIYTVFTFF